ncbi:MAG: hypothetical protein KKE02_11450 [Alphaproteobacteria bacterium]|nr:hypothetical protein [Alphaproteobacteria bacterium]MBU1514210.1 hypothetical protein [Alphaproteobacteria bacterium]MBU2095890.1 hypothetical protein [Alphaproteobacteria bacterium]MBU2151626.1 hypothetical protein [Alphaproteobacteria bacterium]MBU2307126.1 hypothetical protein [Alphaproteobacteria bacterium]
MSARKPANDDEIQAEGRKDAPAQPNPAAEPYPACGKDDGVEVPARGGAPADPVEGKR